MTHTFRVIKKVITLVWTICFIKFYELTILNIEDMGG
jgi:hypothetical protein